MEKSNAEFDTIIEGGSGGGALLPGFKADIPVSKLNKLHFDLSQYEIVHDMPGGDWRRQARARGYDYILVNGGITHRNDEPTGKTPGVFGRVTSESVDHYAVAAE